uniref:Chromophore lyase cpcS/cpeS n=1 Tax=Corynoplastis japonica TaxID=700918 RepID=A0A1X9PU37_9RHOD|nr:chromophore lyase cpcS/cpeS [Corynoplastis japonica]
MNNLEEFLNTSTGNWLAQTTVYNLSAKIHVSLKSELVAEVQPMSHTPESIQQIVKNNPSYCYLYIISSINTQINDNTKIYNYFMSSQEELTSRYTQGTFIRNYIHNDKSIFLKGRFFLPDKNSLIITISHDNQQIYEKHQLLSSNLQLYMNITKQFGHSIMTGFNSCIRTN